MFLSQENALARAAFVPFDIVQTPKPIFHREVLSSGTRCGQTFSIQLAYDDCDRISASEIINRNYGRRGYGSSHQLTARSECMTFTACCDKEIVGTLTLRVDSSEMLGVDETFPDELARLRDRPGVSLCELTKFAFDPSPESRPLIAKLFHVIFAYGTTHFGCSDLVIEVNPRHVCFYKTMLGFTPVGPLRTNDSVDAPSQLMRLAVTEIGTNIARYGGGIAGAGRSLYPHFFGKAQEQEMLERVAAWAEGWDRPILRPQMEAGRANPREIGPRARRRRQTNRMAG